MYSVLVFSLNTQAFVGQKFSRRNTWLCGKKSLNAILEIFVLLGKGGEQLGASFWLGRKAGVDCIHKYFVGGCWICHLQAKFFRQMPWLSQPEIFILWESFHSSFSSQNILLEPIH